MTVGCRMRRTTEADAPPLYQWRQTAEDRPDAVGAFTTRRGGVSKGAYASFNLGYASGDRVEAVNENRRRLAARLDTVAGRLLRVRQTHSDRVQVVDDARALRLAARSDASSAVELGAGDAIVCGAQGWFPTVLVADCVPVLIVDPVQQVTAAVHAGWRGTCKAVAAAAVAAMSRSFATQPDSCRAFIGPSIGPCCYEVDRPVFSSFRRDHGEQAERWFLPGRDDDHWQLDLWRANRDTLAAAGIARRRISVLGRCTACEPDEFYSYRRDGGVTGHLAGVTGIYGETPASAKAI